MRGPVIGDMYERPATLGQSIYGHLKRAIIEGSLKPGQRIMEKEFAELFKTSTTPVREAFQKLAAEKYILIMSRKDVKVASVTRKEIAELFEVARVLDALAARKAIPNLTEADLKQLRAMTAKLGDLYGQDRVSDYFVENWRIHDRLWQGCGNEYLYQVLSASAEKYIFMSNHLFSHGKGSPEFDRSFQDHLDLMDALERRDIAAAEKILLSHWGKGYLDDESAGGPSAR
jgi:DNA-binding GntR family transcriptional regulator